MDDMKISKVRLDDLRLNPDNARLHSPEQIKALKASLLEFGWTLPLLVNGEGLIIAGEGRFRAARMIAAIGDPIPNWEDTDTAPTRDVSHLSAAQQRAYAIADNNIPLGATWDTEKLQAELEKIQLDEVPLDSIGFSDEDLDELMKGLDEQGGSGASSAPTNKTPQNKAKEPPQNPEPIYKVVVSCASEQEQKDVYEDMTERGFACRVLSM